MNILTDEEIFDCPPRKGDSLAFAREIEAAVLEKLAALDIEPVAFKSPTTPDGFLTTHYHSTNAIADYRQIDPDAVLERLYTESQLAAAQLKTAEACAKVCDFDSRASAEVFNTAKTQRECAAAIRNGDWREYL